MEQEEQLEGVRGERAGLGMSNASFSRRIYGRLNGLVVGLWERRQGLLMM
jgi:hypothetical protein